MEVLTRSSDQTKELAFRIAGKAKAQDVYYLYGSLGGGKTTFVTGFLKYFDPKIRVQSPTFIFIRNYRFSVPKNEIKEINHLDLYRAKKIEEALDLGIEEIIAGKFSISLIEWPDILGKMVQKNSKIIKFEFVSENERKISTNFDF